MATIIKKMKKGKPYCYAVQSGGRSPRAPERWISSSWEGWPPSSVLPNV